MVTPLPERLESDDGRPTVAAFPDGSVDRFYRVFHGDERVARRAAFADAIRGGRTAAATLRPTAVEPGGHAVNAAMQADLLGCDVTLVGHLDHPAFDLLPFETVSMGAPAGVTVHEFDDGDLLTVEPSQDVERWSVDALRAAADFESLLSADAVVCANWTTVDAVPDAVAEAAAHDVAGGVFVLDPGDVSARSDAAIRRLFDALADFGEYRDAVLAVNGDEARALAAALDGDAPDDRGAVLERLREAGSLAGAVVHETDAALAATPDGRVRVENFEVDPVRRTGGGDRFDAGMAFALGRGWGWTDALRLGNACASHYVATGESGTAAELAAFLRERG